MQKKLIETRLKDLGFTRNKTKHYEFNKRFGDGAIVLTVDLPKGNTCSEEDLAKAMGRLHIPQFDVKKFLAGQYSGVEIEFKTHIRGIAEDYA